MALAGTVVIRADAADHLLGRIAGWSDDAIDKAWEHRDRDSVIRLVP